MKLHLKAFGKCLSKGSSTPRKTTLMVTITITKGASTLRNDIVMERVAPSAAHSSFVG